MGGFTMVARSAMRRRKGKPEMSEPVDFEETIAEWESLQRCTPGPDTNAKLQPFADHVGKLAEEQPQGEARDALEQMASCAIATKRANGDMSKRLVDVADRRWN
jgi:hypothetical protein